jgi:PAS domain S-box-containing protein
MLLWKDIQNNTKFDRKENATKAGLQSAIAFPLMANDVIQGIVVLMTKTPLKDSTLPKNLFNELQHFLGKEIKRKNLEIEFNQVFNFAPDIIAINNKSNFLTKVNPAAIKILGYTEEELLSQPFYNFIHPDDHDKTLVQSRILQSGEPIFNFQNRYITKSGEIIWLNWTATPSFRNGLTYSVAKDITASKKNEEDLIKLNLELKNYTKELETSNAELEQFAYVASHDLQEPLRMVTSFLTQLKLKYEDALDDKAHTYIHFAVDGAKRMRKIILDILEYSKLGTEDEVHEDVDLNLIFEEIFNFHRNDIDRENAKITYSNLPVLKIGKLAVFQIFNNIISNALKYKNKNKLIVVEITAKERGNYWEFAIADNGIGIPKPYLEKIFVLFQRLHGKGEYSGTGVGLAIVKKLVQANGGKIWVESEINKGSTFYVQLPK